MTLLFEDVVTLEMFSSQGAPRVSLSVNNGKVAIEGMMQQLLHPTERPGDPTKRCRLDAESL